MPGGVGPMTVATLMENTLEAAEAPRDCTRAANGSALTRSRVRWPASAARLASATRHAAYNSLFAAGLSSMRILAEALTFDDVSLVPAHSNVLPRDVDTRHPPDPRPSA